ncbi:E3 ubiquitin-protein ligase TRIM56-like [Hydractinia symbiolongicarpus]|uniref:E3 ubiquitin-protein ligase TRIM56-like n=1 Tax=Hydractinia symbiolongicarpus TaxID=13093 RepID=UPI00254E2CBC|nr:E3 ubiquitin-protein ligase TRIM56-like [Hydractinia symbiolongicarpus]
MALSGATAAQLSSLLECKICLETYHNPKQLYCGHTYCQNCLDDLAIFNEDGSAEIHCPLRCPMKTKLDPHETTSSLMTRYVLNDILNELSNVEKVNSQCQQSKECKRIVGHSCTTCGAKICNKCQIIHSCTNKSFTNVTFNEKLKEMQPLCEEHNFLGRFVCIDCDNKFTCVYCIHRSHKNHERKSVAEFGEEARNLIQSFLASFDETKVVMENLTKQYYGSLNNLNSSREAFVRELKVRKLKRIEDYLKILNTEEENLLLRFDQKMEEFKYEIILSGHCTRIPEFLKDIKELNLKYHFELVAKKLEIERKLRSLSSLPRVIPSYNMHFASLNEQDCLKNPLGELKISVSDVNFVNPYKCSVYKSTMDKIEKLPNHAQLESNLKNLLGEMKGYKESIGKVNFGCLKKPTRDVKSKRESLNTKSYTFEELEKMIKDEDIGTLSSILINNPNIVTIRNRYKSTLLIGAAYHNTTINSESFDRCW